MSNYSRGAAFERRVKKWLETTKSWPLVVRAAGSHGVADLVALGTGKRALLVSCRISGTWTPEERQELAKIAKRVGQRPLIVWRGLHNKICDDIPDEYIQLLPEK